MKSVLLIGLGRFGKNTAIKLKELKHEVMAVDVKDERISDALPYVSNALIGDSTNERFLETLGVSEYDLCIVAIGDNFQASLETTALLKDMGAKRVISRASSEMHTKLLLRIGADDVVYPEQQVAEWSAVRFSSDHIIDYFPIENGYTIAEIDVPQTWIGKTMGELDVRRKYKLNVMVAKTGDKLSMKIDDTTPFTGDERLLVIGKEANIQKCN